MYVETDSDCFDPNDPYSISEGVTAEECFGFSQALQTMRLDNDSVSPNKMIGSSCYDQLTAPAGGMMQEDVDNLDALSFADHQGSNHMYPQVDLQEAARNGIVGAISSEGQIPTMIGPTPDLLELFHSMPPPTSSTLLHSQPILGLIEQPPYNPLLHLTPPHPPLPLMRDLFQSLPHGCYSRTNSLFGGDVDDDNEGMMYNHHHHEDTQNGMLKFGSDMSVCLGKRERKATKHFTTDKEKRCQMNDKFAILMSLIPNPTKTDRASVVGDAIEYIKELLRTVNELKLLVEKKRCGSESRRKRHKIEEGDVESCVTDKPLGEPDQSYNSSSSSALRSSWLHRKSKVTEVDVRIIDDDVSIKLVQRKKINCLLYVSRVLDELQLDLQHVAGGHIGEHYSFLFNSKIYEGSTVFASAIASKLIEAVDAQYAVSRPTSIY